MEEVFIKKYWPEEDIVFYIHYQNGYAVEQIEIAPIGKFFLSLDNPREKDSMLSDQPLSEADLDPNDL